MSRDTHVFTSHTVNANVHWEKKKKKKKLPLMSDLVYFRAKTRNTNITPHPCYSHGGDILLRSVMKQHKAILSLLHLHPPSPPQRALIHPTCWWSC